MATDKDKYPDRIADLFHGRTIFLSGGTGFLGKVLIEKLLRCLNVKAIYVLIRPKKGKSPQERLTEMFENSLYVPLRKMYPDSIKKVKAVSGDVTMLDLGLSKEDRQMLRNEAEFIFHSAATTRFDDTMKTAVIMNTRGTQFMLDLANECKKLKCFIHVSTAYVCPKEDVLEEKTYPPPASPHNVLKSINWIQEGEGGDELTKSLLGDCPNTYTFTKALAESLVEEQMEKLPAIIVRPSVVVPIWVEPVPGWCNNLQGPTGLFVGAGKGIIRTMYINSESHADFIPADTAINGMLLSIWDYLTNKKRRVFNLTASKEYNYSWEEIIELGKDVIYNEMPFNGVVWYPGGSMKRSRFIHSICFYLFQILPALLIDLLLVILGYKPVLYQIQRRIEKGSELFEYYTWKAWNLPNDNINKLIKPMLNPRELSTYKVEGTELNLRQYFLNCIHGARLYLKETDDMIPAAKRNMKIMWCLDKFFKTLFLFFFFYYLYKWLVLPILGL